MPAKAALIGLLAALLLAACAPEAGLPDNPLPAGTVVMTATAIPYREATAPITADSAPQLALLGRLDPPDGAGSSYSFAFSPDGTRLAALSSGYVMTWDLITGSRIFSSTTPTPALRVFYSPDKTEIYTLDETGTVTAYSETGDNLATFTAQAFFQGAQDVYAPEGWLAVGGEDGQVRVWNPQERTSLVTIRAHDPAVDAVVFSADGTQLLTVGRDHQVRLWDWATRTLRQEFNPGPVNGSPLLAPDGRQIAIRTADTVLLYDVAGGQPMHRLPVTAAASDSLFTYTPDGRYLAMAGRDSGLTLWNPVNGGEVGRLLPASAARLTVAFAPQGGLMVTGLLEEGATLWNLAQLTAEGVPQVTLAAGTRRIVNAGWSADGFTLVFFDAAGAVFVLGIPAPA